MRMETGQIPGAPTNQYAVLEGREPIDTRPFELYFALQEFSVLKQHLSVMPQPPEKPLGIQNYHLWFESIIQLWIAVSKNKALNRVRSAIAMDEICEGEKIVRHSTSAVDTASCIYQIKEFWRLLAWPDNNTGFHYEAQLIDSAGSAALHYSDLIHQSLIDGGYYEQQGPFRISDELCVSVNNLEYVRRALAEFRTEEANHPKIRQNTENMLENTLLQLERTTERIMCKISQTMQAPLQKSVFHLVSLILIHKGRVNHDKSLLKGLVARLSSGYSGHHSPSGVSRSPSHRSQQCPSHQKLSPYIEHHLASASEGAIGSNGFGRGKTRKLPWSIVRSSADARRFHACGGARIGSWCDKERGLLARRAKASVPQNRHRTTDWHVLQPKAPRAESAADLERASAVWRSLSARLL